MDLIFFKKIRVVARKLVAVLIKQRIVERGSN